MKIQQEISGEGVFFERCYLQTTAVMKSVTSITEITTHIRQVEIESTILATDFGQATLPPPVEGWRIFLSKLSTAGFDQNDIRRMAGKTPAELLGL